MNEFRGEHYRRPPYFGQPVDVSEIHAISHVAFGVDSLLDYLADPG